MKTFTVSSKAAFLLLSAALVGCGSSTKMVMIKSNPEGVLVTVDGKDVGQTPLQHEVAFKKSDSHTLQLSKEHFRSYEHIIKKDGTEQETVDVQMVRTAQLNVQSQPVATVTIDGVKIGPTPLQQEIDFAKADTVEVTLTAKGYRLYKAVVEKSGPADVQIEAELTPSKHAETLFFDTDPQGATLTMDDEHLCDTPCEIQLDDMDATRKYQVRVEHRGFTPKLLNIQYKGDDWKDRNFPKKMKILLQPAAGNEAYDAKALGIRNKQPSANGPMIIAPMMGGQAVPQPQAAPQPYYQQPQQPVYRQPLQQQPLQQQPMYQQQQQRAYQQPVQQPIQQPVYQQPVYQQPQAPQLQAPAVAPQAPAVAPQAPVPQLQQAPAPQLQAPAEAPAAPANTTIPAPAPSQTTPVPAATH